MLPKDESHAALRGLFRTRLIAELGALFEALDTRSRMSVFRRLREIGYFSSYTHMGRYYTLADIPDFDECGLWRYQAVGFSRFGTLKATVAHHTEAAEAGCTHAELEGLLGVRLYNTLLRLEQAGEIRREMISGTYVYVSVDEERASRQLEVRHRLDAEVGLPQGLPPSEVVLLVLVETLHASEGLPSASVVAARLTAHGEPVEAEQVERVYEHFGLEPGKKTVPPR
jgi:hypothetical protein